MEQVIAVSEVKEIPNLSVDQKTITTLEDLLAKAKTGELKSIIFIDKYKDGKTGHGWAGQPDGQMIGQIENAKFDIFSQMYFPMAPE